MDPYAPLRLHHRFQHLPLSCLFVEEHVGRLVEHFLLADGLAHLIADVDPLQVTQTLRMNIDI